MSEDSEVKLDMTLNVDEIPQGAGTETRKGRIIRKVKAGVGNFLAA